MSVHFVRTLNRSAITILGALLILLMIITPAVAAGTKITSSPGVIALNQGDHIDIELKLTQPIICPSLPPGSPPCQVKTNLASNDPAIVISPTPVIWLASQWAQTRVVTLTAAMTTTYAPSKTVTIAVAIDSDTTAPFYSNAGFNFNLTLNNTNSPPYPLISNQTAAATSGNSASYSVLQGASNDPDPSTLAIETAPQHGSASVLGATIVYTPANDYEGSDSLQYRVCNVTYPSFCTSSVLALSITKPAIKAPDSGYEQMSIAIPLVTFFSGLIIFAVEIKITHQYL